MSDPPVLADFDLPLSKWVPGSQVGRERLSGTLMRQGSCALLRTSSKHPILLIWPKDAGGSYVPDSTYGYIFSGAARLVLGDKLEVVGSTVSADSLPANACIRSHSGAIFMITENFD
ncbi:MAG: hypothetical protein ACR2M5_06965 [Nakamurella sp.]